MNPSHSESPKGPESKSRLAQIGGRVLLMLTSLTAGCAENARNVVEEGEDAKDKSGIVQDDESDTEEKKTKPGMLGPIGKAAIGYKGYQYYNEDVRKTGKLNLKTGGIGEDDDD